MKVPMFIGGVAGICAAVAFSAGWLINGWRLKTQIAEIEAAKIDALEVAQQKEKALQKDMDALFARYQEEVKHADKTINTLRRDVALGRVRFSIPASCGSSASDFVAHKTRAELDPETADALVAIAADGDAAIRELNVCIEAYDRTK